jgi:Ig-like domain from next to BRCA1 gene
MKKHNRYFAMALIFAVIGLSACGGAATGTPTITPTPVDIPAIFTEAAQTVIAQLTEEAPTITPTPLFTDTPTLAPATVVTASPTVQKCEDAAFVSDVTIPDGTEMAVNQQFTKTWRVMNTGTCTWITSFYLGFSYGELMGGQTKVSLPSAVAAGQTVDLSVNLTVPNKTGKLTGVWAIFDNKGVNFGPVLTVVVNVSVPSATPALGVTATPVPPTATNTLAPSATATK